jgi:hypothetical protein
MANSATTNGASRGERLQIMLSGEELKVLDDFRFKIRMPSRAAAVRELLKRGLAAEGVVLMDGRTKSQDFGVTDGDAKSKRDGHAGGGQASGSGA